MLRWLAMAALVAAFSSCRVHIRDRGPHYDAVVDHRVHDAHCGCYWHDGGWHPLRGHRHYEGCGHYYVGTRWILLGDVVRVEGRHVCHDHCDHYQYRGHWYGGHRHGHGCGHVLRGGIWILVD